MNLKVMPPLDRDFQPMSVVLRDFRAAVMQTAHQEIAISIHRHQGLTATWRMDVFRDGTGHDAENAFVVERLVKTLLWIKGGYQVSIAGSRPLYDHISGAYREDGARAFDAGFMAGVYEHPFEVVYLENPADAPQTKEQASAIGRHLEGCRIGFDAGGSDRKVSAVIDGEAVYSEEVVWHPKTQADPDYQYQGILESMRTAAAKMPRVDAIGVSSAGVYVNNRIMEASLFLKVPRELHAGRVRNMYIDVAKEIGDVPLEVANDGDVTALAGAMSLGDNAVLGVAMGTSEAAGYVDDAGNITGWLNELAFVPVDANSGAMVDEWSGDVGCGVKYFSQDGVNRLAPLAGIDLPGEATPAEKLKVVQELMAADDARARQVYETIGVCFGYAIGYYAEFYDIRHVLIMGRVTSGKGGAILLERAEEVLAAEFPALAQKMQLHLPDEKSRRVGQSVAAASLPRITNT